MTLYTGGSDGFVSSTAAPIASGWSEPSSRAGLTPAVNQCLFTAHVQSGFIALHRNFVEFSVPVAGIGIVSNLIKSAAIIDSSSHAVAKITKFLTAISPTTVTFMPHDDGSHELTLKIAVCSFDKSGKPLQFMHQDFSARLTDKQYAEVQAKRGFLHTIVVNPVPGTTVVRVLVKDLATGLMGSVNLPYTEVAAQATAPAPGVAAPDVH